MRLWEVWLEYNLLEWLDWTYQITTCNKIGHKTYASTRFMYGRYSSITIPIIWESATKKSVDVTHSWKLRWLILISLMLMYGYVSVLGNMMCCSLIKILTNNQLATRLGSFTLENGFYPAPQKAHNKSVSNWNGSDMMQLGSMTFFNYCIWILNEKRLWDY